MGPFDGTPARRIRDRAERRLGTRVRSVYVALGLLVFAYVVWQIVRRTGVHNNLIDGWGIALLEIVASSMCIARGLTSKRARPVALVLGAGLMSWSIGDLVLAAETAGGAVSSPSLADAFYLGFYPLTYAAVMLLVRQQVRGFSVVTWLDGAVAGIGAAAICAAFAFHNVLQAADLKPLAAATNLAYPIGDVLLLTLVVGGSAVLPGRRRAQWLMLAAGLTLNAIGDTFNLFSNSIGSSHVGNVFNGVAWPISILLISGSVWLPKKRMREIGKDAPPTFLLPGAAAIGALIVLIVGSLHHIQPVALGLAVATLSAAGFRFGLSLISLRTLTESRGRQAVTDQLTGLGNRRALFQLLDDFFVEQADPDGPDRTLAFLFVDLNGFKEINDSFGHPAGDELLRQLGSRLTSSLRRTDLLVRLGGDEFGVSLLDADAEYAATVAARLTSRLREPFVLDAVRARISASIGIALVPNDAGNLTDLIRCADLAMYRAKLEGKCFAIYQEDLDGVGNRMRLVEELRTAIGRRELDLHYQPQVALPSGRIVAVEALIRWQHPRLGLIPPLEFLPLAEEAGLMESLTRLCLEKAFEQCAAWRRERNDVTISVNISATNLLDRSFPSLVEQLLARFELPPEALVLELTETTAIADFERSKRAIERLRDLGVVVSVDDFGAGVTSLAYLSGLAVGELKLDRSFISDLASAEPERVTALIGSTIELAHSLGLRVVAEGVEDEASLGLLTRLGCDLAQGFAICRPKPAGELGLPQGAVGADVAASAASHRPASLKPRPALPLGQEG